MLLTSYEFLGFLALVLLLYYVVPSKFQWKLLLGASYLFYFAAGPIFPLYILVTTATVYLAASRMEKIGRDAGEWLKANKGSLSKEEKKAFKQKNKTRQWRWMLSCLLFNIGILAVVKYLNFAIANVNGLLDVLGVTKQFGSLGIIVPMGISFYTFQSVGYLIDVYRGVVPAERNPFKLALFVSFFPQLIQGPISRFGDLSQTLFSEHRFDAKTVVFGLERVLWGFFKKLVIADRIVVGITAITKDTDAYSGAYVFVGMMFYALQLYADFTGGIDITIGVAEALGIKVAENFNRPFFSKGIKEYWNRWHMTMGSWFTDYIFYPISVCKPMLKFSKFARAHFGEAIGKRMPVYLSSFAVWLATGVWHGASWNFIVWGLANWVVIMASQELEPLYARFHARFHVQGKVGFKLFQVIRTVLLMSCLRIFDCYRDVPQAFRMFGTLFTKWNWNILWDGSLLQLGLSLLDYGILAGGLIILITVSLLGRSGSVRDKIASRPYPVRFVLWYGLFLAVLLAGAYGVGYDASQFIYNQF